MNEPRSWDSYVQKLNQGNEHLFLRLSEIWNEIGYPERMQQVYRNQAYDHLVNLMNDMVQESEKRKINLSDSISELLEDIHTLSKDLKCDPEIQELEEEPLLEIESRLKVQFEELNRQKKERFKTLAELQNKELEICKALGAQPLIKSNGIPSNEELMNFELYLEKQNTEKIRLQNAFEEMRDSILNTMHDLGRNPSGVFEILVFSHEDNFVFTNSNMIELRKLRDNLQKEFTIVKQEAEAKREELMYLWESLEIPEDTRKKLLNNFLGQSSVVLQKLDEEIKLCKIKRKKILAKLVEKARDKLRKLWTDCGFTEEQREQFKPYYETSYSEDLLAQHNSEIKRLEEYYVKNKKLYELFCEFKNLLEKFKELDQRSNDPERLNNRGGQLLIEEKERNLIKKKLPKLEEQINIMTQQYEADNGTPFKIHGVSCDEFFTRTIEDYAEIKENLKKQRQAKITDKSQRAMFLTSTSKRTPTTLDTLRSAHTSIKKRDAKSPLGNLTKRNRIVNSEKTPTTTKDLPRKHMRTGLFCTLKKTTSETNVAMGSEMHYEEFQQHLKERDDLSSSHVPEKILKNSRCSRSKVRTPIKTPLKLRRSTSAPVRSNETPKTSRTRNPPQSPKLVTYGSRLVAISNKLPFFI